jgi:hypothetical protein
MPRIDRITIEPDLIGKSPALNPSLASIMA